jgi:hypothetical protein
MYRLLTQRYIRTVEVGCLPAVTFHHCGMA